MPVEEAAHLRCALNSISGLFGEDSNSTFYKQKIEPTLFGEEESVQTVVNLEQIGEYYLGRLKTIFAGVAEEPLILLYLLYFATGNPRAADKAVKIAQDVLRK